MPFVPSDVGLVIPKPAEPLDEPLVKVTGPELSTDQQFCFTPFSLQFYTPIAIPLMQILCTPSLSLNKHKVVIPLFVRTIPIGVEYP